jgi:CheY-like chemotaxis protein
MPRIFIVDDDLAMDMLRDNLRFRGHEVERITSAQMAFDRIKDLGSADLLILDIIMAWPDGRPTLGLGGALTAGMEVLLEVRKRNENLPVIVYSAIQDAAVITTIEQLPHSSFISKWEGPSIKELVGLVQRTLGIVSEPPPPPAFIVHRHDENAKLALKNFLQNTLKLPEPVILHEQPNLGRTIMEKFEDFAATSSLVFVLLTPDDTVANADGTNDSKRRARQNVVFEMGYFLGVLGRRSGRVLLLFSGPLDMPSDISGLIYIDISGGIAAAGESIRKELQHVAD